MLANKSTKSHWRVCVSGTAVGSELFVRRLVDSEENT